MDTRDPHTEQGRALPAAALDSEHLAAIDWTRITEGCDVDATALVAAHGYAGALDLARRQASGPSSASARWAQRLDGLRPFELAALEPLGIDILTWADSSWPAQLNDLGAERPVALWARGEVPVLARNSIAIVGSRDASGYGKKIARDVAFEFSKRGFVIVSGGAFGIDAEAHRGALLADGQSVIVSAGGVDRPYPRAHEALYADVLGHGGAVVSESPLGAAPQRHRFLSRNRIIAALGIATIVVEAPYRSGALNTARHAMAMGRDVGAFPGPIDSHSSAGCHELIRNGATLVATFAHIDELVGTIGEQLSLDAPDFFHGSPGGGDDALTKRVIDAIPKRGGAEASSIARVAGLSLGETLACLGRLSVAGRATVNHGKWRAG